MQLSRLDKNMMQLTMQKVLHRNSYSSILLVISKELLICQALCQRAVDTEISKTSP